MGHSSETAEPCPVMSLYFPLFLLVLSSLADGFNGGSVGSIADGRSALVAKVVVSECITSWSRVRVKCTSTPCFPSLPDGQSIARHGARLFGSYATFFCYQEKLIFVYK